MADIEALVKAVISRQLSLPIERIQNDQSFSKDLGADSLDTVSLLVAIEEEFKIQISDEDAAGVKTVQQAIDCSKKLLGNSNLS